MIIFFSRVKNQRGSALKCFCKCAHPQITWAREKCTKDNCRSKYFNTYRSPLKGRIMFKKHPTPPRQCFHRQDSIRERIVGLNSQDRTLWCVQERKRERERVQQSASASRILPVTDPMLSKTQFTLYYKMDCQLRIFLRSFIPPQKPCNCNLVRVLQILLKDLQGLTQC